MEEKKSLKKHDLMFCEEILKKKRLKKHYSKNLKSTHANIKGIHVKDFIPCIN